MRRTLRYSEAAQDDRVDALTFYRKVRLELARAFDAELRGVAAVVRRDPLLGAPYLHGTRRKLFSRFPYSLVYSVEGDDLVLVIAVAHHRRDPTYWADRVKRRGEG